MYVDICVCVYMYVCACTYISSPTPGRNSGGIGTITHSRHSGAARHNRKRDVWQEKKTVLVVGKSLY